MWMTMPWSARSPLLGMLFLLMLTGCSRPEPDSPSETSVQSTSSDEVKIASGRFVDKGGQKTSGTFFLERVGEDLRLVLGDDFRTDEGPDLHVVLTSTTVAEAGNDNAMAEGAEVVSKLAKQAGEQVYDLRDDLRLDQYNSVVIHCIEFSHLYGAAPLR